MLFGLPSLDVGMVVKVGEKPRHGNAIQNTVDTVVVIHVADNGDDKAHQKLDNLNLRHLLLPHGWVVGKQGCQAIVEVQENMHEGVHAQKDCDAGPGIEATAEVAQQQHA